MLRNYQAHGALFFATFIFGANYWVSKSLMPGFLHPFQIIFFRTWVAMLLFWITSFFLPPEKIHKKDWLMIIICSLIGVTINQTLFFSGLNLTSPVEASIIHVANPVLVLLFSVLLGREKVTIWKAGGMLMGASGAAFIVIYGQTGAAGAGTLTGNLLICLNITCWALYLVLVKPLMMRYRTVTVMKWLFLFGFVFALPFTVPEMQYINWDGFTLNTWMALFYVVAINTYLAYFLTNYSLKSLSPSVTSYYIFLQPLIVAIIAVIIGSGTLTGYRILAGLVIIAGAWLVSRNSKKVAERNQ